ncbi:hypothetical protein SLEP1_g1194 [Rubroshorea leprosula]|uniref:Uncharacterized protein n=1 Tax=Rubroshorea leprosula TaxID=152421 RepID=A0AAV5HIY0_9ROSI|nr:hypothetical protein SLEP1_g1194 [Rubroshorea leprosula]
MKQTFKLANAAQIMLPCLHGYYPSMLKSPFPFTLISSTCNTCSRELFGQTHYSPLPGRIPKSILELFIDKFSNPEYFSKDDLIAQVSKLRDELVQYVDHFDGATSVLGQKANCLISGFAGGRGFLELLKQLFAWPHLALEV